MKNKRHPVLRMSFMILERLREESRHRTKVVVRVPNIVRVELELAAVEVEVRSVVEDAIGIQRIIFARLSHRSLKQISSFKLLNLIRQHFLKEIRLEQK
jgi:hypothetical protein